MRVVLCLVLVAGCSKKSTTDPQTGSGSGSSGSAAPIELGNDPTRTFVTQAFGGKLPAFPMLSKDGAVAAMGIESPIGSSDVSTYQVAFFASWTGTGDAWGSNASSVQVFDVTMAKMLLDGEMGEAAPRPDSGTLKTRADAVTKQLTDQGFAPFEGPSVKLEVGETAVGPAKVKITRDQEGGLSIEVAGQTAHPIKPFTTGHVADVECIAQPVPRNAWFDTAHKRLLLEIGWNAGPDACNAPDPELGLIAIK
jgi:hypothetical protein